MKYIASDAAEDQVSRWPPKARRLFNELLEDCASSLQQEMLTRVVGAGHTPGEAHAFADVIRGMTDAQIFQSCTFHDNPPVDLTLMQLANLEADPLAVYESLGGVIEPNEADDEPSHGPPLPPAPSTKKKAKKAPASAPPPAPAPKPTAKETPAARKGKPAADVESTQATTLDRGKPLRSDSVFQADSPGAHPLRPSAGPRSSVAMRAPRPSVSREPSRAAEGPSGDSLLDDLVNHATASLGISWDEWEVDVNGGLTLADAISQCAAAVQHGIPVPMAIGPARGKSTRFIIAMQLSVSGKNRAWELFDPVSRELVWCNERDLLGKTELPFSNKANRRITRVVLPTHRSGDF